MTKSAGARPRRPRTSKPDSGDQNWVRPANLPPEILALESAARTVVASPADATARAAFAQAAANVDALAKRYGKTNRDLRAATEQLLIEVEAGLGRSRVSKVEKAINWWAYHRDRIAGEQRQASDETRALISDQKRGAADAPWVVGFRWVYDPEAGHSCEVCKALALADNFGLGPGGYPKDRVPELPAHDGCTCYLDDIIDEGVEGTSGHHAPSRGSAWVVIGRAILAVVGAVFGFLGAIIKGLFGGRRHRRR